MLLLYVQLLYGNNYRYYSSHVANAIIKYCYYYE